jgi:hypothetical protein
MLLLPRGSGKVGRCRVTKRSLLVKASRLSYFVAWCNVREEFKSHRCSVTVLSASDRGWGDEWLCCSSGMKRKARSTCENTASHYEEASTIFGNPLSVAIDDLSHSVREPRGLTLDHLAKHRLLVVAYTD